MPETDGYEVAWRLQELDCPDEGLLVAEVV
jgi:hypothetical protein